jgi:hypothetical protein
VKGIWRREPHGAAQPDNSTTLWCERARTPRQRTHVVAPLLSDAPSGRSGVDWLEDHGMYDFLWRGFCPRFADTPLHRRASLARACARRKQ